MPALLAYAPDERWAFVREGGRVVLVRPPFQQDVAASEAEVARAVTVHGFVALERDFASRRALLDFLGDESVRVWRERGAPKHLDVLREELLAVLTVADLDRHIARAGEKIDAGKHEDAQALLTRLLTAKALTGAQQGAIASMLRAAQSARGEQEEQHRQARQTMAFARFERMAGAPPARRAGRKGHGVLKPAA